MIKVKPKRGKLRTKSKAKRPLGTLLILGGLLVSGYLAQTQGHGRQALVWEDFEKVQGVYLGHFYKRGKPMVSVQTPAGIRTLMVDEGVRFTYMPTPGMPVEVAYTKADPPRIVRGEDLKPIDLPDETGLRYNPRRHPG